MTFKRRDAWNIQALFIVVLGVLLRLRREQVWQVHVPITIEPQDGELLVDAVVVNLDLQ